MYDFLSMFCLPKVSHLPLLKLILHCVCTDFSMSRDLHMVSFGLDRAYSILSVDREVKVQPVEPA